MQVLEDALQEPLEYSICDNILSGKKWFSTAKKNTKIFYLVVAHYVQTAVQIDIYVYVYFFIIFMYVLQLQWKEV